MNIDEFRELVENSPEACAASRDVVQRRAGDILRPRDALKRLDDVAVWIAGWHRSDRPKVSTPVGLVFAADHGVARDEQVSAYPTEVTAAMLAAYNAGQSTLSAFADVAGARVIAHDVGVARPTGNIAIEDALSNDELVRCIDAGLNAVNDLAADLIVIGEMGIGNTTVAAALAAANVGGPVDVWVGRGTGVDDDGYQRKLSAVQRAVDRVRNDSDPLEILRKIGGSEIAAMVGAIVGARHRSIPVLLDGYVVTAAASVLFQVSPQALDHTLVGHCSAEPGHRRLLDHLGMDHLLDLDMRLGEGSGAMAAVPLVKMACAGISNVPTFGEWFGA